MSRKIINDQLSVEDNEVTKICKDCGRELPVDKFNYWNKELGTHMIICKECEKKRKQKKHDERRNILNTLKSSGCCCCNESDVNCLDFHHIDPQNKEFNMSVALNKPVKKMLEEASKCVVVCANCHRKIHAGVINIDNHINRRQHNYMNNIIGVMMNFYESDNKPKSK